MRVRETLLLEGGLGFGILCYGVFSVGELDKVFERLRLKQTELVSNIHKFIDEEWPNGLLLIEVVVTDEEDVARVILEAMIQMFEVGSCVASFCMYDGAFGDYADIFSEDIASQIYAFSFVGGEPVVALDANILAANEWGSLIAGARRKLVECQKNKLI